MSFLKKSTAFVCLILLNSCSSNKTFESDKLNYLKSLSDSHTHETRDIAEDSSLPPAWLAFPGVDVQSYALRLKVDSIDDQELEATLQIEVNTDPKLKELRLHLERSSLEILSVSVDGKQSSFNFEDLKGNKKGLDGEALKFQVDPASKHNVEISYTIKVQKTSEGFFFVKNFNGTSVLSTRSWPYFARSWLPSHDHPSDQAKFSFEINTPKDLEVFTSAKIISSVVNGARKTTLSRLDHAIPTYAANIVFGDFKKHSFDVCYDENRSNPKRVACTPRTKKMNFSAYLPPKIPLQNTFQKEIIKSADSLAWLSSSFGNYEFGDELGIIVAPHPFSMEHVGLITLISPSAAVHEVVHQWFGNSIAIAHWGEFWISEGFTTYMTGFYDELLSGKNSSCFQKNGVLNNPANTDPLDIFDNVAYCKGAAALDDLRVQFAQSSASEKGAAPELLAFQALIKKLYSDYRLKPLSSSLLTQWLKDNGADIYKESGLQVSPNSFAAAIELWSRNWFSPSI